MAKMRHSKKETVYILCNPSMEGLYKIGFTRKSVYERIKELSSATGVPTPFVLAHSVKVSDGMRVESKAHKALKKYRVNGRREFFKCSIGKARRAVDRAAGKRSTSALIWALFLGSICALCLYKDLV